MDSTSSTINTTSPPSLVISNISNLVSIKLDAGNYLMWKSLFEPILRGHKLMGFVDGSTPAPPKDSPSFNEWYERDQMLLSWINATLSTSALPYVVGIKSAKEAWDVLARRYASITSSHVMALRKQLHRIKKGTTSMADYLQQFKVITDQLAASASPISEDELLYAVLDGLPSAYRPLQSVIRARARSGPMPIEEVHNLLICEELSLADDIAQDTTATAFAATRSAAIKPTGSGFHGRGSSNFQQRSKSGQRRSFNSTNSGSSPPLKEQQSRGSSNRPQCQICHKMGHTAIDCFNRMNYAYQGRHPPEKLAAMAASHTAMDDSTWYSDTGATHHVTSDFGNLTLASNYNGADSVQVGNGEGLYISHIGSSTIPVPSTTFKLHNVLYCPNASSNLLSVNKLSRDNNCYFIFDEFGFVVKDKSTGKILYRGTIEQGLYPFRPSPSSSTTSSAPSIQVSRRVSPQLWHHRLGHPSHNIQAAIFTSLSINKRHEKHICSSCQLGKSHKLPFSSSFSRSNSPLEIIHCDVWGPAPTLSCSGFKYYVLFIDDFTRFSWLYPICLKSDVFDKFIVFKSQVENLFTSKIKIFRSDNGGEFRNNRFHHFFTTNGILHQFTCPYTPEQNGVVERKNRHIVETGLSLLAHSSLPTQYWAEAFLTATYLINRMPLVSKPKISPFEALLHKPPDYHHLRAFGCLCFPCLRPYRQHKLDYRSTPCIFLGYSLSHKGYRCLSISSGHLYISRHVVFDESVFPYATKSQSSSSPTLSSPHSPTDFGPLAAWLPYPSLHRPTDFTWISGSRSIAPSAPTQVSPLPSSQPIPSLPEHIANPSPRPDFSSSPTDLSITDPPLQVSPLYDGSSSSSDPNPPPITTQPPSLAPTESIHQRTHSMTTRSMDGISKKKTFLSTRYPLTTALTATHLPEPTTYSQASKFPEWRTAMDLEFTALQRQGTWTLVPHQPHMNVVGCKWVFRIKRNPDGSVNKYKARLVAKGFHQQPGIDFIETFSPVVKHTTIRVILSLALAYNWPLRQLDVECAFLHGDLHEEVYMAQPQGYVDPTHPSHVCRMIKSIYGLRQAPRAWYDKFASKLLELGFNISASDPSLFIYAHGNTRLYLLLYVDDIIITGNQPSAITSLIRGLSAAFHMKDMGPLTYFLGITIRRSNQGIFLSQSKYIMDLLDRTNMTGCKPMNSPASSTKLGRSSSPLLSDPTEYRSIVGALQYVTLTRPDIAFAVNQVCQFLQQPTDEHLTAVKRILRFLKGTITYGLFLQPGPIHLEAYCDADWAGCPIDRRSTNGFCVYLGSNPISWCAKKQSTVSRSSTEAEYRCLAHTTAELYWLCSLLKELQVPLVMAPIIWCDNISAIALAFNPVFHARTKHIEIDYHFVREKVAHKQLDIRYISSIDQVADIFTKGLPPHRVRYLQAKLCLRPHPRLEGG